MSKAASPIRLTRCATWRSSEISIRWRMWDGQRGEGLQRLERLPAPLRVLRAQAHGQELLQQAGLALGGHPEDAQVARLDAVGDSSRAVWTTSRSVSS